MVISHLPKFFHRRIEGEIANTEEYEGKEVDYYVPKSWDLIYQPFIPRDKSFWGISIMEDIHDINEAIKKAVYQHEEQHLKGNKKILCDSQEVKIALESSISSVIYVKDPNQSTKEIDMNSNIDGVAWINQLKEWMQLLTGATNSALGVRDQGVTSGRQAQVYVEQANFKVALKTAYKASAYKRIYRTIADFALAFVDEARPFRIKGEPLQDPNADPSTPQPKAQYGKFDRLAMLKDMSGNYIYPDFDIEINAESGFMKSRSEVFNTLSNLAGQGRFEPNPGNLTFLKLLNKLGVPDLQGVIDEMGQIVRQMQQAPKQEEQKGPAESISFRDLPIAGQIQLAAKAGIQLQPQDLEQMQPTGEAQGTAGESRMPQEGKQPQEEANIPPEILQAIQELPESIQELLLKMDPDKLEVFLSRPQEEQIAILQQIVGGQEG